MPPILDSKVLQARKKDVEDVIYKTGNIKLYDLKLSFSINDSKPKIIPRNQIIKPYSIEVLKVADKNHTFVVHPDKQIQKTNNGGTIKIMNLEAGYKFENEVEQNSEGPSGEFGLNVSEVGLNFKLDNSSINNFKVKLKELTHDHLVLIIDANIKKGRMGQSIYDSANIELDYIQLNKDQEEKLCNEIERKREE